MQTSAASIKRLKLYHILSGRNWPQCHSLRGNSNHSSRKPLLQNSCVSCSNWHLRRQNYSAGCRKLSTRSSKQSWRRWLLKRWRLRRNFKCNFLQNLKHVSYEQKWFAQLHYSYCIHNDHAPVLMTSLLVCMMNEVHCCFLLLLLFSKG